MSNKRIGCENFGKFYTEGKVRNRREWRGVVDTLYDYSRWLHNWITMAKMVSKPRNIKAMFRYRWMSNYLAVPMMVDRHTQGLRGEHLRICHLEQDLIIEDVAKLLDGLFRGDRRIGNDKAFSDKVVLVDENKPFCGVGAQIASLIADQAFDELDAPIKRVSSLDAPQIYAKPLEDLMLPTADRIVATALTIC